MTPPSWPYFDIASEVRGRWGDRLAFVTVDHTRRLIVAQMLDGTRLHYDAAGQIVDAPTSRPGEVYGLTVT